MTRRPVQLGSFDFYSAGTAKEFMREKFLRAHKVGEKITNPDLIEVLEDLLSRKENAEEKRGPGIEYWFIDKTANYAHPHRVRNDAVTIAIHRIDGKDVDFGYTRIIDEADHADYVKEALATAVEDLRDRFKFPHFDKGKTARDFFTDEEIFDHSEAEVRYFKPGWGDLTRGFADTVGGWDAVELSSGDGDGDPQIGRTLKEPKVAEAWREYYRTYAMPILTKKR